MKRDDDSLNLSSFEGHEKENLQKETVVKKEEGKKKSKKKLIFFSFLAVVMIALIVVFAVMIANNINDNSHEDETEREKPKKDNKYTEILDKSYSTSDFEYKTKLSDDVKKALNSKSESNLLLVNKKNPLGESYVPSNLAYISTNVTTGNKQIQLCEDAKIAAEALIAELWAEGYKDITITSAYRSYSYQLSTFDGYVAKEMEKNSKLTREDAENLVLEYSAKAGYSEHQSGLCIDLYDSMKMVDLVNYGSETKNNPYDKGFAELEVYNYLKENAHKFGFILRYPEDKTQITGYKYESWHYRFVGVDVATKIYKAGITFEEYLEMNK